MGDEVLAGAECRWPPRQRIDGFIRVPALVCVMMRRSEARPHWGRVMGSRDHVAPVTLLF